MRPSNSNPGWVSFEIPGIMKGTIPALENVKIGSGSLISGIFLALNVKHVHVHSLVDFPGSFGTTLTKILADIDIKYDVTFHDYAAICPRINLIDNSGQYCGEPVPSACNMCIQKLRKIDLSTDIDLWRKRYEYLLKHARLKFVPSKDTGDRLKKYFREITFTVRPHAVQKLKLISPPTVSTDNILRIGILGALGPHKGSKILLDCANDAVKRGLKIQFKVYGFSDNQLELEKLPNVSLTGPYQDDEIYNLLKKEEIDLCWFPAVWPETFSYTLSIAINAGLYPVCFDFGAIAERIKQIGWGAVMPASMINSAKAINDRLIEIKELRAGTSPKLDEEFIKYSSFVSDYYAFTA